MEKSARKFIGMMFPIAIEPQYGIMKVLPRRDQITEDIYSNVTSGNFFLT